MSEYVPTQPQLEGFVDEALRIVNQRLSGGVEGSGLYPSLRIQLEWLRAALGGDEAPDPARIDALLLGVYAARELDDADPLATLLFDVQYLAIRRWPTA